MVARSTGTRGPRRRRTTLKSAFVLGLSPLWLAQPAHLITIGVIAICLMVAGGIVRVGVVVATVLLLSRGRRMSSREYLRLVAMAFRYHKRA
jgi:hypothetical protein